VRRSIVALITVAVTVAIVPAAGAAPPVYRIDHVADGDTVDLRNGQRVRLVQIDTPEVFCGAEC
jgi:endonuclease YncB( thermonuclease family)